jgi:DNA-binding response OmpR family regulator
LGLPVLVCSASARQRDGTLALRLGADGFIAKPVDLEELSARVARILAPTEGRNVAAPHPSQTSVGNLRMDRKSEGARVHEAQLEMTPTEFRLLFTLAKASGGVLTRAELSAGAWGYEDAADGRTIDVHIGRLRRKLRSASADVGIVAVRGEGYQLVPVLDQAA